MTTLYRPVPIKTAEQAEALPEGTLATHPSLWAREKVEDHLWQVEGEIIYESKRMVGFTALVPIEAEEETHGYIKYGRFGGEDSTGTRTRLVTPWEEA